MDETDTTPAPSDAPPTCGFPGCERPATTRTTPGRPPKYCENPAHTALTAFRARQADKRSETSAAGAVDHPAADDLGRPVSLAGLRLRESVERFGRLIAEQRELSALVAADVSLIANPEAVEAQISAVQAEAA